MGCLLCCKKKKKNGELVNPLFSEAKEPINEKKDISITVENGKLENQIKEGKIDEETIIEIKGCANVKNFLIKEKIIITNLIRAQKILR